MGFWEQATDQAGREFGARHWRWFAGVRVARRLAPAVAVVLIGVTLLIAYRLVSPDWPAVGASIGSWAPGAGRWALIGTGALIALALIVRAGVALWQAYAWRWWLSRPMWMRRY